MWAHRRLTFPVHHRGRGAWAMREGHKCRPAPRVRVSLAGRRRWRPAVGQAPHRRLGVRHHRPHTERFVCRPSRSRSVSDLHLLLDLDLIVASFLDLIWLCLVITYVISMPRIAPDVGNNPSSTRFARRTGGGRHPNDQTNSVFFRKHRPVMVQFAACQIDLDCLILLLHTYLCICTCLLYMHKYAIIAFPYCWFMLKNRFVFTVICQRRYGGS